VKSFSGLSWRLAGGSSIHFKFLGWTRELARDRVNQFFSGTMTELVSVLG
jgi:hypothetical protein